MSAQLRLELARAQGEEGMRAAAAHADAVDPGWTDVAFIFLVKFAQRATAADRFTAEAITDAYAEDANFVQPPDQRAWGGVFKKAANRGVLVIADYRGVRRKGHGTTGAKRYRSLVAGKPWSHIHLMEGA